VLPILFTKNHLRGLGKNYKQDNKMYTKICDKWKPFRDSYKKIRKGIRRPVVLIRSREVEGSNNVAKSNKY
jgi:hypothetical protein